MGQIEDLRLFINVVDAAGISKAADVLNIAKSAVSRRLSLLEERYDTRLIDREPGRWEITETGRELYQRANRLVHDMDEIEGDFSNASAAVEGPLTVSVPREFGIAFLQPSILAFKTKYPQIRLTVDFSDRSVDLARENIDLAVRITGALEDGLEAERIGSVQHRLYASPRYLSDHEPVNDLCDLHDHRLLYFGSARRAYWEFQSPAGQPEKFVFQPFLNSNSGIFLLDAVRNGLGIARLPDFIVNEWDHSEDLIEVLPGTLIAEWGIYLVQSQNQRLNRRMRLFAEEMKRSCLSQ